MTPDQFLKTIYLGDRACKGYSLDAWQKCFALTVDQISRIRSPDGVWDGDTSEDIEDGQIVFENVESIEFSPPGLIPNDYIQTISAEEKGNLYLFRVSVASVRKGPDGVQSDEVFISVSASGLYLTDPKRHGIRITK